MDLYPSIFPKFDQNTHPCFYKKYNKRSYVGNCLLRTEINSSHKDAKEPNLLLIILCQSQSDSRGQIYNHFPSNIVFFALKTLVPNPPCSTGSLSYPKFPVFHINSSQARFPRINFKRLIFSKTEMTSRVFQNFVLSPD